MRTWQAEAHSNMHQPVPHSSLAFILCWPGVEAPVARFLKLQTIEQSLCMPRPKGYSDLTCTIASCSWKNRHLPCASGHDDAPGVFH